VSTNILPSFRADYSSKEGAVETSISEIFGGKSLDITPSTATFTFNGKTVNFGTTTDLPVMGDWDNDGKDEIGVFRPDDGGVSKFYLVTRDWDSLGGSIGSADYTIPLGGSYPNNIPVGGNWDGVGGDDIGGYNPETNTFYLYTLNLAASSATRYLDIPYGVSGDKPITGDWDGNGKDEIGVFRPYEISHYDADGYPFENIDVFYLDLGLTGDQLMGSYVLWGEVMYLGPYLDHEPLIGDWDGNGFDNLGVYSPSEDAFYPRVDLPPPPPTPTPVENRAPDQPSELNQFKSDGTMQITVGGVTDERQSV
jgi:hypothetical protein